ncbi:MAG: RsmB/NOP family class I SAM-dependent RNA methyltransferase, partial [Candidatus Gracilibacteria bacterium]|nr:RsmB/NOP family class I SAM-dependent RNA methyltransferase [Candidatus Gracilibacteria bacterium]
MLPKKYLQRIESFLSKTELAQTIKGYSEDRVCSFRINTLKSSEEEVRLFLNSQRIVFEKVPYLPFAYTLDQKDEFALKGSPLFYEGKIYVQGLTSQMPGVILEPKEGMRVLGVTAAPGSKTTQIAALMNNTGTIVACEKHQIRHDKLAHNIRLQGATNIETYKMDALKLMSELPEESFDAILLDAPCGAEGRFKLGDERAHAFWTLGNIRDKAIIQKDLLGASIPLLKKGGVLVYSTCTLAPE